MYIIDGMKSCLFLFAECWNAICEPIRCPWCWKEQHAGSLLRFQFNMLITLSSETSTCILSLLCHVVDSIYLQLNVRCWSVDPYIVHVHQKSSKPHSDNIWHPTHGYNLKLLKIISKIQIVGPACLPRHLDSYKVNDVWDDSFKYIIIKST